MLPPPFDYVAPRSLDEVLELLAEHGDEAKVLAGGQSLIPVLKLRLGERFAPLQDSHVLQSELEQYFRQNMEQRATDASPACQTPRAHTLS